MTAQKRKQIRHIGGGQKVTTVRYPLGGPRRHLGLPHASVLVHPAPYADKSYLRQLLRQTTPRLADLMDDESAAIGRVATTCLWIAPDGAMLTAHKSAAQITLFARDIYGGRLRAFPLLPAARPAQLSLRQHHIYDIKRGIGTSDEIYINIESGKSFRAMDSHTRLLLLERFLNRGGTPEEAADFLARLAERAGVEGSFSITFARLAPQREDPLLISLFEGDSAKNRRLAAGLVPVLAGMLQRDIILRRAPREIFRPRTI